MGCVAHKLLRKDRRLAEANLAMVCPDLDEDTRRQLIADAYRNYGDTLALSFLAGRGSDALWTREHVSVEGVEHLHEAKERGRGVMLVSGHLGYWELSALRAGLELDGLHVVYRPLDNPHIDRDVAALRDRFGIRLVPKSGAASQLLRALKRGESIGLLPDQRVPAHQGIIVPFLGHPAVTTSLPAALARRTGCAVVPIFCLPDGEGGATLKVDPPVDTELCEASLAAASAAGAPVEHPVEHCEGSAKEDPVLAALTTRIMAPLEREILARPDLWLWAHRRWLLPS